MVDDKRERKNQRIHFDLPKKKERNDSFRRSVTEEESHFDVARSLPRGFPTKIRVQSYRIIF